MLATLRSRRFALFALAILVVSVVGEVVVTVRGAQSVASPAVGGVFIPPGKRVAVTLPSVPFLSGGTFDPASVKGRVTVVNLWASWCPPCYAEAPTLQAIADQQAGNGVSFLGVDAQESSPGPGQLFVADRKVTYPNVFDGDGKMQLALSRAVKLGALPVTIVIDAQGRVGAVVYGEARFTVLTDLIRQVSGQL